MSRSQKVTSLARSLDPARQQRVSLQLNAQHIALVNRLLASGMWGTTPAEVCRRLFDSACAQQATQHPEQ